MSKVRTEDTTELRGMIEHRIRAVIALREAQNAKHAIEMEITREVFNLGMHECMSINWSRLGQTLRQPVD